MLELTVLLTGYTLIGTVGLLLMRLGLLEIGPLSDKLARPMVLAVSLVNLKFLLGFACYAVSFFLFAFILSRQTVTYAFPLATGLSYGASVIGAFLFLGERVDGLQLIGILLIGAGVLMVMRS
jgi:drug/metabolite transporter (DMT)-like permease